MSRKEEQAANVQRSILLAGVRMFSRYGFDGTTTRMIAENAGVHLSQLSFYYGSKESLYNACAEFIASLADSFYSEASRKAETLLARGKVTKKEAYASIAELIDLQIIATTQAKYRSTLKLIYWEQFNSTMPAHPISDVVYERVEKIIAELFVAATGMDFEKALVASRFVNGAVIAFGEHSLLVRHAVGEKNQLKVEEVSECITQYCRSFVCSILDYPVSKAIQIDSGRKPK